MTNLRYAAFIFGLLLVLLNVNLMRQYQELAPAWLLITTDTPTNEKFYIMQANGSHLSRLPLSSNNYNINLSPDNKRIYVTSSNQSNIEIFYLSVLNNKIVNITNQPDTSETLLDFAHDNKQIIYRKFNSTEDYQSIWSMSLNGSNKTHLIDIELGLYFQISPDKAWIYKQKNQDGTIDLERFNIETQETDNLTHPIGYSDKIITWSPDNSWIIFSRTRQGENENRFIQLWRMRPDGREAQQIVEEKEDVWYTIYGWDRDNQWMLVAVSRQYFCISVDGEAFYEIEQKDGNRYTLTNNGYFIVDSHTLSFEYSVCGTEDTVRITQYEWNIRYAGQTYDNRWILYRSIIDNYNAPLSLHRVALDGTQKLKLFDSVQNDTLWKSPDNKWVYRVTRGDGTTSTVYRVRIDSTQNQQIAIFQNEYATIRQWL